MDIQTITMPVEQAQAKLQAYRGQLRKRADDEYEKAAAGYKALAEGKTLINLTDTLVLGGIGPDKRPRLAVARADREQVEFTWEWSRPVANFDTRGQTGRRGFNLSLNFAMPKPELSGYESRRGFALVPMVPADVRPDVALRECLTLWEVEHWADRSILARPDRDPYLLRHIAGDLYAVLAQWDLTELERAVMAERVPA